jgi:hypothetical protein
MTKDMIVICAEILVAGAVVWSFWDNPQSTKSAKTQVVRIVADDAALKLVSEKSTCMRTER